MNEELKYARILRDYIVQENWDVGTVQVDCGVKSCQKCEFYRLYTKSNAYCYLNTEGITKTLLDIIKEDEPELFL